MKQTWTDELEKKIIELLKTGLNYFEIGIKINKTSGAVRLRLNKLGYKSSNIENCVNKKHENVLCKKCGKEFSSLKNDKRKFCSRSCSTTVSNIGKQRNVKTGYYIFDESNKCLNCNNIVKSSGKKYCSNKCQGEYTKFQTFQEIENGNLELDSRRYKDYLIYKHDAKCMECGWDKVNSVTGNVPIQLHHIDGNADNNQLENLKLLCPNCHSLTPNFGKLNKNIIHKRNEKRQLKRTSDSSSVCLEH